MKFLENWLVNPTELLSQNSGVIMWDTRAGVDKDGVLTFCQSPATVAVKAAKLILASSDAGHSITLFSGTEFRGIQTHYERPPEKLDFNMVSVSDELPDTALLFAPTHEGSIRELPADPARVIAWTLCRIVNKKISA